MADPKTTEIIITSIVTTIGANGIIGAPFLFWLKHRSEKKLERLKTESVKDIEQLKKQLQVQATSENLRFSHVFKNTADTIVLAYQKLVDLRQTIDAKTGLMHSQNEQERNNYFKQTAEKWQDFGKFYTLNKIYIPRSAAMKITELTHTLQQFELTYSGWCNVEKNRASGDVIKKLGDDLQTLLKEIPKLLDSLEREFQGILGFPVEENKTTALAKK